MITSLPAPIDGNSRSIMIIDTAYEILTGPATIIAFAVCMILAFLPVRAQFKNATALLLWSTVLVFGLGALAVGWGERLWLAADGVETTAQLVSIHPARRGAPRRVTYTFTPGNATGTPAGTAPGRITRTRAISPPEITSQIEQDSVVHILYLPAHPVISNIHGNRYLMMGDIVWATLILLVAECVAAAFWFHSFEKWWADRRAARERTAYPGQERSTTSGSAKI